MVFDSSKSGFAQKTMQGPLEIPYWMKVLEERYRRLHAKVVNGTVRFTTNHNVANLTKRPIDRGLREHKSISKRNNVISQHTVDKCDLSATILVDKLSKKEDVTTENTRSLCIHTAPTDNLKESVKFIKHDSDISFSWKKQNKSLDYFSRPGKKNSESSNIDSIRNGCQTYEPKSVVDNTVPLDLLHYNSLSEKTASGSGCESLFYEQERQTVAGHSRRSLFKEDSLVSDVQEELHFSSTEGNTFNIMKVDLSAKSDSQDCTKSVHSCYVENNAHKRLCKISKSAKSKMNYKANNSITLNVNENDLKIKSKKMNYTKSAKPKRIKESSDRVINAIFPSLTTKEIEENKTKVFSQMSVEARLAVNETLKEMKNVEEIQHKNVNILSKSTQYQSGNGDADESHRNSTDGSTNEHSVSTFTNQNRVDKIAETNLPESDMFTSTRLQSSCNGVKDPIYSSGQKRASTGVLRTKSHSGATVKTMEVFKTNKRILPHLNSNNNASHNLPSSQIRLPSIGSSKTLSSFRENTFEITPLNFDIRLHQIFPGYNQNNEDPSADILQQSIQKCNRWLIRYILKQ